MFEKNSLAQGRHGARRAACPLSGGKADIARPVAMSPNDPRVDILDTHVGVDSYAPIASDENTDRKRKLAFWRDPFVFFGDAFDAVARVGRISIRGGHEVTNFIWTRGG